LQNIDINFIGHGNFAQVQGQVAALKKQFDALNVAMNRAASPLTGGTVNPEAYRNVARSAEQMSATFRAAAASSGQFNIHQYRGISAAEQYTQLLQKQKLGLSQVTKGMGTLKAAYREQLALRQSFFTQWGRDEAGRIVGDLAVPNAVHKSWDTFANRAGFAREVLRSVSTATINWGKNVQWAGRQLMVGFTMPIAAFGAAAAVSFYKADQQLTRIAKVYDTTAKGVMAQERELAKLRADSMKTGEVAAQQYGVALEDTLSIEADFAATGLRGEELMRSTTETLKNATLGEIDHQVALKATIALQSILQQSAQETADSWAYMNAVENATSLSMSDFAEAIPIAMGPLEKMGGNLQDLGTLLVAMKERGIEANQGANAIKSMMQRLYRPSQQIREEWQAMAGVNLKQLVSQSDSVMEILKGLDTATRNLPDEKRIQLLGGLFGTYQVTRMSAMMEGLTEGTKQVSRVLDVNNDSVAQWRRIQDRELEKWQNSVSGRFKTAIAELKVQLAEMGEPFLNAATSVLEVVTKIIGAFNDLPEGVKKWAMLLAVATAIAGPIIMLIGLTANLVGWIGKSAVAMIGLATRFKILDRDSVAAKAASDLATKGFVTQTEAIVMQTQAMNALHKSYVAAAQAAGFMPTAAQAAAAQHGIIGSSALYAATGRAYKPTYNPATPPKTGGLGGASGVMILPQSTYDKIDDATRGAANNTKEMSSGMKMAAASSGLMVGSMAAMALTSNETANNIAMWGMYFAMFVPMLSGLGTLMKGLTAANLAAGASKTAGFLKSAVTFVPRLAMGMVTGLAAAGGIVTAIGAIAAGLALVQAKSDDVAEKWDGIASSGKEWAGVLGFSHQEVGTTVDPSTGEAVKSMADRIKEVRENMPDVVSAIKDAKNEQQAMDIAIRQGLQVYREGGTAADALEAIKLSLTAAFDSAAKAKRMMLRFDVKPMFKTDDTVIKTEMTQMVRQMRIAYNDAMEKSNWESVWDFITRDDQSLNEGSQQQAANAAKTWYASWVNQSRKGKMDMFREVEGQFKEARENIFSGVTTNREAMSMLGRAGIQGVEGIIGKFYELQRIQKNFGEFQRKNQPAWKAIENAFAAAGMDAEKLFNKFRQVTSAQGIFIRNLALEAGLSEEAANNIQGMEGFIRRMVPGSMKIRDAFRGYTAAWQGMDAAIRIASFGQKGITKEQKLQILNQWRVKAGLQETNNLADGFKVRVKDATAAAKEQGGVHDENIKKIKKQAEEVARIAAAWQKVDKAAALRGAFEETMQDIADIATENFEAREERAMKALDARAEARMDSFERRSEQISNRFDRQMEQMQREQERETEQLQREQERETNRLQIQQENQMNRFDNRWEARTEAVEDHYDKRIDRVNKAIRAEERAEEIRQRIFDAEATRIQRLNDMANRQIDFSLALNTGDFDEAARVRNDASAQVEQWALEDAGNAAKNRSERRVSRLQNTLDRIEKERDTRIEALQDMEEAHRRRLEREQQREQRALEQSQQREQRALENKQKREQRAMERERERWERQNERRREQLQDEIEMEREAAEKIWETRRDHLDKQIEKFQNFIPRNEAMLKKHTQRLLGEYIDTGKSIEGKAKDWSGRIGDLLQENVRDAARSIKSDINWEAVGNSAATAVIRGAFGMSKNEFFKWLGLPGSAGKGADGGGGKNNEKNRMTPQERRNMKRNVGPIRRHTGGVIGIGGDSGPGGTPRGSKQEVPFTGLKGEGVLNTQAMSRLGPSGFRSLNDGSAFSHSSAGIRSGKHRGGFGEGVAGLLGGFTAGVSGMMVGAVKQAVLQKGREQQALDAAASGMFTAGKAGMYGGRFFGKEQLRNAAIIASVGSRMRMSPRDIMIGIMTAITESGLINVKFGDRDSLGLFQQRPSQGWGSPKQVTDPEYASRKFFQALKRIKKRDGMTPWMAAQSVQRSGTADGSNYKPYWDDAQAIFGRGLKESEIAGVRSGGHRYPGVEPVKPWVREAAEYLGALHDIKTIGGYRPTSAVANSDHPKGLALDLMTRNFAQGNAIAKTVERMWKVLDVTYMIWKQRIKTNPRGRWERMENRGSPTANHMDHVHLSFQKRGDLDNLLRSGRVGDGPPIHGKGKKHRPTRRGTPMSRGGAVHDQYTGYPALDIDGQTGDPIYAIRNGRVTKVRHLGYSYGNHIYLDHGGFSSLYAHLKSTKVRGGQKVRSGQIIGRMGSTGHSTGDHLHFGVTRPPGPRAYYPNLNVGGNIKWDNTIANLHKNETVLTEPLSRQLKDGIANLDRGTGDVYDIDISYADPTVDPRKLADDVIREIDRKKSRTGVRRTLRP